MPWHILGATFTLLDGRTLLARDAIVHLAATSNPRFINPKCWLLPEAVAWFGRYHHTMGREDAAVTQCLREH